MSYYFLLAFVDETEQGQSVGSEGNEAHSGKASVGLCEWREEKQRVGKLFELFSSGWGMLFEVERIVACLLLSLDIIQYTSFPLDRWKVNWWLFNCLFMYIIMLLYIYVKPERQNRWLSVSSFSRLCIYCFKLQSLFKVWFHELVVIQSSSGNRIWFLLPFESSWFPLLIFLLL